MLPPECVDVLLRRAAQAEDDLIDALQDAVTYRYIATRALSAWHREAQLRLRTELRLRELLGMPDDVAGE